MAASLSSSFLSKAPIIVVLGATGTGKSKLAIELALKYKGEVINADSMQVYKGLNIATNKVTKEEQQGVRHHLLGFLDPSHNLMVSEFRNMALAVIKDILERDRLPIIVGGTNYYIESVLYNVLIDKPESEEKKMEKGGQDTENGTWSPKRKKFENNSEDFLSSLADMNNATLHKKLKEIDPEMADVLHPNNRRKIIRSLQVHEQFGETLSSLLKRQRSIPGGSDVGGPLRLANAIVLWLQCESNILNERLDARVDGMISQGLVNELLEFNEKFRADRSENQSLDYTKGILQTIGFKEFKDYLSLDKETRESEKGGKLLKEGIDLLKLATRQYAKRQCKWVQNRLLRNASRQVPPIYGLDASDCGKWKENVYDVAEHIVECRLSGKKPSVEPLPVSEARVPIDKTYFCETCDKILVGVLQFEQHMKSRKHSRVVSRVKLKGKKAENKGTEGEKIEQSNKESSIANNPESNAE